MVSSFFVVANMDNGEPEWNTGDSDVSRETNDAYGKPLIEVFADEEREMASSAIAEAAEPDASTEVVNAEDTVDSAQAAAILEVTVNNLRQLVFKKKLIPVRKQGTRLYYDRNAVLALKEARSGKRTAD